MIKTIKDLKEKPKDAAILLACVAVVIGAVYLRTVF